MATVWLARDLRYGRQVALKVLHPELASTLGPERFLREIEIAASLAHPNILPLHESGEAGGFLYYVMPYVEGESLRDRLRREIQLPLEDAIRIAREVADALGYAHAQGLVHRDVKPENILLEAGHAVVADFGVARAIETAGGERLTGTGLAVGTPAYMSPEQAGGSDRLDGRSDIYSLGCVLYEMLAGEPPFSAPTPQALAAKHLNATPPAVRVTRGTVPAEVERVIERALAKVPADRFGSALEFAKALESDRAAELGHRDFVRRANLSRRTLAVAGSLLALGALVLWGSARKGSDDLDRHRVVVFPLRDALGSTEPGAGEAVATYIGYALEGSEPLRWLDGWDLMSERERAGLATVAPEAATRLSRSALARYYIDGSILRTGDSVAVVLRLHDAEGDTLVTRAGSAGPTLSADLPQLGVKAVAQLLPTLIGSDGPVDLSHLSDRRPSAVAAFLQGERAYRRMHFQNALTLYDRAIQADSQLALAAIKAAWAALWLERYDQSKGFLDIVLSRERSLPARYIVFARGLQQHLAGAADLAANHFKQAIQLDGRWVEAWTALGEVYYHLLPRESPTDSLARAAFLQAERLDSGFRPALLHLAGEAIRRSDFPRAEQLLARLTLDDQGSERSARLRLMLRCVQEGTETIDWRRYAADSSMRLEVPRALSGGGYQTDCAREGFRAAFEAAASRPSEQWGALLGLQAVLASEGRWTELRQLLDSEKAVTLGGEVLYLVLAAAGAPLEDRAAAVATRFAMNPEPIVSPALWAIGLWAGKQGHVDQLQGVVDSLAERVNSTGARVDSVVLRALRPHLLLLRADTAQAIAELTALTPSAPPADLEWQPWEALGSEKILLAQLLLSRHEYEQALAVAAQFDSPQPVLYGIYLPASLSLRRRAAEGLGRAAEARRYGDRLHALQPGWKEDRGDIAHLSP